MPVHRVPRATLHDAITIIGRKDGEHVLSVTPDPNDTDYYLVITEERPNVIETR